MKALSDEKILDSWEQNVIQWSKAIEAKQIESREGVTNKAIIEAIASFSPKTVLDIGCGEGWLARELSSKGIAVTGIDAMQGFIEKARELGGGDFHILKYEDIATKTLNSTFDIAVCNFSLLGKESVEHVFMSIHKLLKDKGCFIIQTLHPHVSCGDIPYKDSWREGSWEGFSKDFIDPAPWYFRTLESWVDLFYKNGFKRIKIKEPINPVTGKVASLLLSGCMAT